MRLLPVFCSAVFAACIASPALAQAPAAAGSAQGYPNKPIRVIVAYQAGQGTDVATRYLADQLGRELGQPIVVENRAGAGGNLGTEVAAQAAGDGYTLTMGTNATHVLNQYLYAGLRFDPEKDFEPIALVGTFPMVFAVGPQSQLQSAADLLAEAKKNARTADVGLPSTTARLVVELLKERSGVRVFGVPYKGSATAMNDLLGGQVPVVVDTPTALRPQIAGGKVRPIGVTSSKPSNLVPGVKPVAEQGFPGFEVIAWNALYAPKGTPPAVISTLNAAITKVLARPETQQKLLDLGFEPAGGTPAQLAEFARAERRKWEPIIKGAGIKAE
jgi:tripartite-type tricarboxylate transporter receptor subunit TctC